MTERSNIVQIGHAGGPQQPGGARRFQLLVDSIRDYAICMLDPEGFVATWNSGAERLEGYRRAEIVGQHFSRLFTAEDQAAGVPGRILDECRTTGRFEGEGWCVRKDGTRFRASIIVNRIRDGRGALIGFARITRDITERVAAQEALLEAERSFRLLVQGVTDYAIYMLDPSGIVTNWNLGAERMKGYRADEIVGQHFSRFYTEEDRAAGKPARVLEIARAEGRYEAESWRVRKDGSRFWASVTVHVVRSESGKFLGFAKITRDITERLAAQQALYDSERQLRLFIQSVVDYAMFTLDPNGVVTSWNPGAQRIKGYTPDEVIGTHFSRFYTESDRAEGMPGRALYTAVREGRFEVEGWRVRKDGTLFWASVVIDPIRDESGKLAGFAKVTRDVTERRNAQLALQEAQKQRTHAQKMEALGHLTGGVAHDFNNLLMVVSGYVQTLKKLVVEDPKGLRAAQAIELAAQRGQALTRQLLSFARRQALNPVVIDVGARLEALRPMLKGSLDPSTNLSIAPVEGALPVKADPNELDLALINLTLNARDAMQDGGTVSISAESVVLTRQDDPHGLEGEFVAITVSDTGGGIPPDILERVFDPFFTTKKSGNGLGLSQVHGMVHQSGGTVAIRSELGKGTRVTLYFPRAGDARSDAAEGPALRVENETALLVEDNPEVADASAALLEELGFAVHAVADARSALQAVEQQAFDLIVTDIVMAGPMDGLELARRIRQRSPDLPIILVTGYSEAAAAASQEFAVLRKPYQLEDLGRVAARVMGRTAGGMRGNVIPLRQAP